MSWFDKFKAGLNVANVVTSVLPLPVPKWAKQAQKVAHVSVRAYEVDRRAPGKGKLPSELPPLSYEPGTDSFLIIQLPGEDFVRKIKFGELAYIILKSEIKKEDK